MKERMNDRMTTKVLKTRPRVGAASPITQAHVLFTCTFIQCQLFRWFTLKKRLALSKQRLSPHIQSHSATITHDLQIFDEEVKSLHNEFLSSDCLLSQCDSTNAHTLINEYYKKLLSLQAQAKDLMELQELLQSAVVNFSLLKQ